MKIHILNVTIEVQYLSISKKQSIKKDEWEKKISQKEVNGSVQATNKIYQNITEKMIC